MLKKTLFILGSFKKRLDRDSTVIENTQINWNKSAGIVI